jgi:hypothetical protein
VPWLIPILSVGPGLQRAAIIQRRNQPKAALRLVAKVLKFEPENVDSLTAVEVLSEQK